MILKINNMLDKELFKNELEMLPGCVQETINERLQTLEEAFGNPYLESGFGNVAIYIFTDVTEENKIKCKYQLIRVEKKDNGYYTISGRFTNLSNIDKMTLVQFCMKKDMENMNK